mgnify:CR=1 FL=1
MVKCGNGKGNAFDKPGEPDYQFRKDMQIEAEACDATLAEDVSPAAAPAHVGALMLRFDAVPCTASALAAAPAPEEAAPEASSPLQP